ncbi:MAG TPA: AMP-binding protein [Ramlibacter sp.]|nr:AMP-binding protein [Ramlibacter sp.]
MLPRELIERCARNFPNKVAYYHGTRSRTWAQMHSRSDAVAGMLQSLGIGQGDAVAIIGFEGFEIYEHFFACMKIGAIRVGLNRRYPALELLALIQDCKAKALLVQAGFEESIASIRKDLEALRVDVIGYGGQHGFENDYESHLAHSRSPVLPAVRGDDALFYTYTSGTTGTPKGIVVSHEGTVAMLMQLMLVRGLSPDDIVYIPSQSSWVTVVMLVLGLMNGLANVLPEGEFSIDRYLEDIQRLRVTVASFLPTVMRRAIRRQRECRYDLSSLRLVTYGSAPASQELVRQAWEVFGCEMLQAYGCTEAGGWVTVLTPADHRRAIEVQPALLGSVGRAGVLYEVSIRNENAEEVATGVAGEIWIRGPSLMKGYLNLPEQTREVMRGDWLSTNDIGRLDADGYLYLLDRKKFLIITGGVNVFPSAVEAVLHSHASVHEAAVVGVPHPEWGEAVVAMVEVGAGAAPSELELIKFCQLRLSKPECPKRIVFEEIPKSANGKVDKLVLRNRLLSKSADLWGSS